MLKKDGYASKKDLKGSFPEIIEYANSTSTRLKGF